MKKFAVIPIAEYVLPGDANENLIRSSGVAQQAIDQYNDDFEGRVVVLNNGEDIGVTYVGESPGNFYPMLRIQNGVITSQGEGQLTIQGQSDNPNISNSYWQLTSTPKGLEADGVAQVTLIDASADWAISKNTSSGLDVITGTALPSSNAATNTAVACAISAYNFTPVKFWDGADPDPLDFVTSGGGVWYGVGPLNSFHIVVIARFP